jgi:acetyl/propionyl-CoA carboxylase alpha subunit
MRIETVAVYSDSDAAEPHVSEADASASLPGSSPAETYLNGDALLAAATESGADAIHPGYGFLAENSGFARAVLAAGLTWIGPAPEAIEVMGSKLASKQLMETVGVPSLPGVDLTGLGDDPTFAVAEDIGYPVLVKASAGGGGKGMRVVHSERDLSEAIAGARREASAAFGDETVFLERYLEAPRHIEFQVFGDSQGNVVSLFERECSIQRRHQKIIEEAPSVAIDPSLRKRMGSSAVSVAKAVAYLGAGTVEFLLQDGEFWFLEMNTRLQVEHPVTEMLTGLEWASFAAGGASPVHYRACHRGQDLCRGPGPGIPPGHRAGSSILLPSAVRVANRLRRGGGFGGLDPLRPDAGQGDRTRRHP